MTVVSIYRGNLNHYEVYVSEGNKMVSKTRTTSQGAKFLLRGGLMLMGENGKRWNKVIDYLIETPIGLTRFSHNPEDMRQH
jgi:hypothetical protein